MYAMLCQSKRMKSSDKGLMLKTLALKLFTVANLHYQLSWWNQVYLAITPPIMQHHSFFRNLPSQTMKLVHFFFEYVLIWCFCYPFSNHVMKFCGGRLLETDWLKSFALRLYSNVYHSNQFLFLFFSHFCAWFKSNCILFKRFTFMDRDFLGKCTAIEDRNGDFSKSLIGLRLIFLLLNIREWQCRREWKQQCFRRGWRWGSEQDRIRGIY